MSELAQVLAIRADGNERSNYMLGAVFNLKATFLLNYDALSLNRESVLAVLNWWPLGVLELQVVALCERKAVRRETYLDHLSR